MKSREGEFGTPTSRNSLKVLIFWPLFAFCAANGAGDVNVKDVCPTNKVKVDCSALLLQAINRGEYEESFLTVDDPLAKSIEEQSQNVAYCNENFTCRPYGLEQGNFARRIKLVLNHSVKGIFYVELLIPDDLLVVTCQVIRKQNKDPLVHQVTVSSSIKCLSVIVGQDVEFKISQDRMPTKENIQDVGWYWQQQRIVHCNSSFCQLEDCKIPCPQFQPKLMIKGTTLLLTRVGEEEDGLELQCRIYPHTMGTIINTESTPQVYKFKIDVLPTGFVTKSSKRPPSTTPTRETKGSSWVYSSKPAAAGQNTLAFARFLITFVILLVVS